jgi:hypothetical protein
MRVKLIALAAVAAAGAAGPASAHHSFAMFDRTKTVVLNGVVKEFQWTNPHSWVQLQVPGPDGQSVSWSLESGSPSSLARQGWKRTSLKAGDRVAVTINPLRSGEHGGNFIAAKFADGTVLGRNGGTPEGAPQ